MNSKSTTGHLPNGLTLGTIKLPHRSYPQNPIIADALFMTAFLESWGTGVSRMVKACKAVGLPEPEYGTDGLFVWITFKRPNASAKTGGQTGGQTSGQTTIEQVYSLIKDTPTITRAQLMELTGKSSNTIQKCILKLKQDNRIKRIGSPTFGGYWQIIE